MLALEDEKCFPQFSDFFREMDSRIGKGAPALRIDDFEHLLEFLDRLRTLCLINGYFQAALDFVLLARARQASAI